jgi:hypothetical protein
MAANEKRPRTRATATPKRTVTRTRRPKPAAAAPEIRYEHVAERAYFLWQNGAGGDSTSHWLQAERELTAA